MITIHPNVQAAANQNNVWKINLFKLEGTPTLYRTDSDKRVKFNGQIYEPAGITYNKIKMKRDYELDTYKVKFDNVDEAMLGWVLNADPTGGEAIAYQGYASQINGLGFIELVEDTAIVLFSGTITNIKAADEMTFSVKSGLDLNQQRGPKATQTQECRFKGIDGFRGRNCGYAGSQTECNYTWARCQELGNENRYGGFKDLNETANS